MLVLLTSCNNNCSEPPGSMAPPQVTTAARGADEDIRPVEPDEPDPLASKLGDDAAAKKSDWLASLPPMPKNALAGCRQCHVDVEDEFIGSKHFDEKVACTDCHGPSEGHIADENNDVKPEELFAHDDVDRLCGECHECSREDGAEPPAELKICTDCHQSHAFVVP